MNNLEKRECSTERGRQVREEETEKFNVYFFLNAESNL